MPFIRIYALAFLLAVLGSAPLLGGCAGMPLQEMSDARQAIRAAERAGAQQYAPELLAEAKALVETARQNVHKGEYRDACEEAEQARESHGGTQPRRSCDRRGCRLPPEGR